MAAKTCARCGADFGCQAQTKEKCWCMDMGKLAPIPAEYKDCLCPTCLKSYEMVEGVDYYYESGFMVFTEKYHLKRGNCCNSGCRHCPYEKK